MYAPGRVQLAECALDSLASAQQQAPASAFDAERVLRVGDGLSGPAAAGSGAGGAASATSKAAALSAARAATAGGGAATDKGYGCCSTVRVRCTRTLANT